jgi:hypothetical protein
MTFRIAALGAVAALMAAFPLQAATIVQNGSFESGPSDKGLVNNAFFNQLDTNGKPNWDVWKTIPGWTSTGSGIEIQSNRTISEVNAQGDGLRYVELDSHPNGQPSPTNSSMSQTVSLKRAEYLLSFWFSPRAKGNSTDAQLAASNVIDYSLGSLVSGSVTGPSAILGTAVGTWTKITASFIVETAGNYSLRFAANGTQNTYGGLIDNVAIDYVAPVPVPAAGLLLLGGLGGLAALKRRRKA